MVQVIKKHKTRAISREAYLKHIHSGKQATQWMEIYDLMGSQPPMTRSEISQFSGMRMSSVCGRVHELIEAGMLKEYGRRTCKVTGEPAHPVGTVVRDMERIKI